MRLMADDAELAARAAGGERQAVGEIYDRYAPLVRAILFDATGSLDEANDLVQEVFLRALSSSFAVFASGIDVKHEPRSRCG